MMKRHVVCLALLAALLLGIPTAGLAYFADLKNDWGTTQNPNGVWSYRAGGVYLPGRENFFGQFAWAPNGVDYIPFWYKNATGDIVTHPSANLYGGWPYSGLSQAVWTSPISGRVDISGGVWEINKFDENGHGREAGWLLLVNGVTVSSGYVWWGDQYSRSNPCLLEYGSGGLSALSTDVHVGDTIALGVYFNGNMGNPATLGVNMSIESVAEPGAFWILGSGLAGIAGLRTRRKK